MVSSGAIASLQTQFPGHYRLKVEGGHSEDIFQHNPHVEQFLGKPDVKIRMDNPLIHESHLPWHFLHSYCQVLSDELGHPVPLAVSKPELYLSDDEKQWKPRIEELTGRRLPYWLIQQPGAKNDYTVKFWPTEYLQEVVDRLRGKVLFVQVGNTDHNHKPLRGCLDEIGKTDNRQLIRLAYWADGAVCGETFLHWIMGAWSKPCVTIASGWLSKQWVNLPTCTLLSRHGSYPCCATKACGAKRVVDLRDGDKKNEKLCELPVLSFESPAPKCMVDIKPDEVVRAVEVILESGRITTV